MKAIKFITVDGKPILVVSSRDPLKLPWAELGIDIVIEGTGVFVDCPGAVKHIQAGAKKFIITAPAMGADIPTYVVGLNEQDYGHEVAGVISNVSCTTNYLAPFVKILDEEFAFYPAILPYAETFFHEAVGKFSDGCLIIDFIVNTRIQDSEIFFYTCSQAPWNAIFERIYKLNWNESYRHGANFAAGSSTVMRQNKTYFDGGTPFTLEIQVEQFNQFKSRTGKFFAQENKTSYIRHFPGPEDFAKAIFTLDIGQNDIADVISNVGKEDSQALISNIVDYFSKQIQSLHSYGARTFWIHNTGPIGCLPVAMPIHNAHNNQTQVAGYLDQNGCVNSQNDLAKEFNTKLRDIVVKLRAEFPDASLTYVDVFSAKYEMISNANKQEYNNIRSFRGLESSNT